MHIRQPGAACAGGAVQGRDEGDVVLPDMPGTPGYIHSVTYPGPLPIPRSTFTP